MAQAKNIGIDVKAPKEACEDVNCPFHGSLKARGMSFVGTVIASKMAKTATVEWVRLNDLPKYERLEKRRSRVKAHNPACIDAQDGDKVRIAECRALAKSKNFVIIENLGKVKGFEEMMEAREEAKFHDKEEDEEATGETTEEIAKEEKQMEEEKKKEEVKEEPEAEEEKSEEEPKEEENASS